MKEEQGKGEQNMKVVNESMVEALMADPWRVQETPAFCRKSLFVYNEGHQRELHQCGLREPAPPAAADSSSPREEAAGRGASATPRPSRARTSDYGASMEAASSSG